MKKNQSSAVNTLVFLGCSVACSISHLSCNNTLSDTQNNKIADSSVAGIALVSQQALINTDSLKRATEKLYKNNRSTVRERVINIIADKLGVDNSEVTDNASFTNDLGADSLDVVELIMEFEKEFNISIPDNEAEKIITVGQVVNYIELKAAGTKK